MKIKINLFFLYREIIFYKKSIMIIKYDLKDISKIKSSIFLINFIFNKMITNKLNFEVNDNITMKDIINILKKIADKYNNMLEF